MKVKEIKPSEIITTKDFPVHNTHILKIYFKICQKDSQILPATPVIPLSTGLPLLNGKTVKEKEYNKRFKEFIKHNRKIKYLMCDGSHKTTALTLTHHKIHAAILKTDKDVSDFQKLVEVGEILSFAGKNTIKEILFEKADHLKTAKFFETVTDKTQRMVKEKVIPSYMIKYYTTK
jgi:hypothetical protein